MSHKDIGELLVEVGFITEDQLEFALSEQKSGELIPETLVRESLITEHQLIEILEFQLGVPHVNIHNYPIELDTIKLIPAELAKRHQIMPMRREENDLFLAMADPMDYLAIEEIRMATGLQIIPAIATRDALQRVITQYYELDESIDDALDQLQPTEAEIEESDIFLEDSPIVKLVNQIISNASAKGASDIHVDPQENDIKIRYRVDGVIITERTLPKNMQNVITARLKIIANLNITESRIPQDGRIKVHLSSKSIDIRISTLPAVYGEKVVMRILDFSDSLNHLDRLGFTPNNLKTLQHMIDQPNGIVLITGPTGSGKSSTLYAALNKLNSEEVNIITIEDPVEYQLAGVNQVQVNDKVGMTFASGLRSILRQDPDIVMIGEIRDYETAQIAVRTSLTGHLVLSTLHTNSAVEALTRLIDMGVEPFLISSSLSGVIAQRLIRRVCRDCSTTVEPTANERDLFHSVGMEITELRHGKGCGSCNGTGYRGRLAIHEVLPIDEEIRVLINKSSGTNEIREIAKENGMLFLLEDGLLKVKQGITTIDEVLKVATAAN